MHSSGSSGRGSDTYVWTIGFNDCGRPQSFGLLMRLACRCSPKQLKLRKSWLQCHSPLACFRAPGADWGLLAGYIGAASRFALRESKRLLNKDCSVAASSAQAHMSM